MGLGNIGGEGSIAVMEGKAGVLKSFGGINGVGIGVDRSDSEEIIKRVKVIGGKYGGINVEDI